jgi:anti-sigma regulatory factor (Ser/Thr protein kinase)
VQIVLSNKAECSRDLHTALERFSSENCIPSQVQQALDLALQEHFANLLEHAYTDGEPHQIIFRFQRNGDWLEVEVEDDGREFNPLLAPVPNTSLPLEERPLGGLGIHLMRKFLDGLGYKREQGRNILRMRKALG